MSVDIKIAYSLFCDWCKNYPDLDARLHTHSGRIGSGGYIAHEKTYIAFNAFKHALSIMIGPLRTAEQERDQLRAQLEACGSAEPVATLIEVKDEAGTHEEFDIHEHIPVGTKLYTHPQAPAVAVPERSKQIRDELSHASVFLFDYVDRLEKIAMRAAISNYENMKSQWHDYDVSHVEQPDSAAPEPEWVTCETPDNPFPEQKPPHIIEHIGYYNTKYQSFFKLHELAHTHRNDELFATGELIKVYRKTKPKLNEHREPDYKAHEWQPIETAPKDGTDFLGYEDGYGIKITWWDDDHDEGAGGWRNIIHGWRPTIWIPLPAIAKASASTEE